MSVSCRMRVQIGEHLEAVAQVAALPRGHAGDNVIENRSVGGIDVDEPLPGP